VDEFMSSSLTGMEKLTSAAISKAKRSSENFNGPARKRNRKGGGGGGGCGGGGGRSASGGGQSHGGNQNSKGRIRLEYNATNANVSGIRRRIARAKVHNEIAVG
jgi:hypothetical protein